MVQDRDRQMASERSHERDLHEMESTVDGREDEALRVAEDEDEDWCLAPPPTAAALLARGGERVRGGEG